MAYPDPVFVGGSGRSGTTIVGRLVGEHSRYAYVPVEAKFHAVPEGLPGVLGGKVTVAELVERMRTKWFSRISPAGRDVGLDRLVDVGTFDAALTEFELAARGDLRQATRRLLRAVIDPVAERAGKPSWVEMTPYTAMSAPRLLNVLPDMRLVYCLRDGRDVAASVSRVWESLDFESALGWWANRVLQIHERIARLPADRVLVVRIEDLAVHHREAAFAGLLDFLGLDEEPAMRSFFESEMEPFHVHAGRWRQGFSSAEARGVTDRYERLLGELDERGAWWARHLAGDTAGEPLRPLVPAPRPERLFSRRGASGLPASCGVGVMRSDSYEGRVILPYAIEEVEGATHLLVSFPGLNLEGAEPLVEIGKRLGELRAHRLFIGADSDFYFGPNRSMAGAITATRLIWREAERLGVAEHDVITYGVSAPALVALYVGLKAKAGRIFAGAPPIRMADRILRLNRANRAKAPSPEHARLRRDLLEMTRVDRDAEASLFYDRVIWRAAARATHDATIHLFASPDDPVVRDVEWFFEVLRDHPTIACHLELHDYGGHSWAKLPFFAYLQRTLLPDLGSYAGAASPGSATRSGRAAR